MRNLKIHLLLIPALALITKDTSGQTICDSIFVEHIGYAAVDAGSIEVSAYSITGDCIGYPSFVLYNMNGDTLAKETVNFFCVGFGQPQSQFMNVLPGVTIPSGPFAARLELFSGFGDTLVCSWEFQALELCPADSCIEAEIYLVNTGPLVAFPAYWWIDDANNNTVASGILNMDTLAATHFDTVCLAPGSHTLYFTPFSPIDDTYIAGITDNWQTSIGTNVALQNDSTPLDLSFSWFAACASSPNAIQEAERIGFSAWVDHTGLFVQDPLERSLGMVQLFSIEGRLLLSERTSGSSMHMAIDRFPSAVHLLVVTRTDGSRSAQRIFIP